MNQQPRNKLADETTGHEQQGDTVPTNAIGDPLAAGLTINAAYAADFASKLRGLGLAGLADRANAAFNEARKHRRTALAKALEVGVILQVAKDSDLGKYGGWTAWVEANCAFSARQAQKYMKLARLVMARGAKANLNSLFAEAWSLERALTLLGDKQPRPPRLPTSAPSGKKARGRRTAKKGKAPRQVGNSPTTVYSPFTDPEPRLLYTTAWNKKTGALLTSYVGPTRKHHDQSCGGCPRLKQGCYARQNWQASQAAKVLKKARKDLPYYDLAAALARHASGAKAVRLCASGDGGAVANKYLQFDLTVFRLMEWAILGYTRWWRRRNKQWLRDYFLASCDTLAELRIARAKGWFVTLVLPPTYVGKFFHIPGGGRLLVCPGEWKPGFTCVKCRLCDLQNPAWKAGKIDGIAFIEHGAHVRRSRP